MIPLQSESLAIWQQKYQLKDHDGNPIDRTIDDTFRRVAKALAAVEATPEKQAEWEPKFYQAMLDGAIPAGRILSNAGAGEFKSDTSLINCVVSKNLEDSMDGILDGVYQAGMTLKRGSGIGYCFSTLRPRGAYIAGAGAKTSGPLSFMDIYDKMCFSIASAGGRRGAQMATFDVGHPDIEEFIKAKREDGRFRQFNCSVLVDDAFMGSVCSNGRWPLSFPMTTHEIDRSGIDLSDTDKVVWRPWPIHKNYLVRNGLVACKIYKIVKAADLWDTIMRSTYEFSEPGVLFVDRINEQNNNGWCENIIASNPCGEQILPPNGACLLGSINLTRFVEKPFTIDAYFDWDKYCDTIAVFTRMLDNVVDINGLPLEEQRKEIISKRRHGMGYMGLGSAMAMLGIRYGSEQSVQFTDCVSQKLAMIGWRQALALSLEKGPAPILDQSQTTFVTPELLEKYPDLDGFYKVGMWVRNSVLHAKFSGYMKKISKMDDDLTDELARHGARFTHHSSIAPTGTLSLSIGNNCSNGIEPSFSHHYQRNVIVENKKTKEQVSVYSYEYLAYREMTGSTEKPTAGCFVTADDLTPHEHIDVQAAAQYWIDSSISKTVNVPSSISFEDFKDVYQCAYDQGLKGVATFRFNPEIFQGVLVHQSDLENTTYRFVMEDGSVVDAKGNEQIQYDGEVHTAANLYDAIHDGYYGKL